MVEEANTLTKIDSTARTNRCGDPVFKGGPDAVLGTEVRITSSGRGKSACTLGALKGQRPAACQRACNFDSVAGRLDEVDPLHQDQCSHPYLVLGGLLKWMITMYLSYSCQMEMS